MTATLSPSRTMPETAGVEHRDVDVNGVRLHVAEAGDGDPLLLLHGWPQHWWQWRHLIGPLSERYRVLAPDFRGLGWSEAPERGYSIWDLRDDVLGLMDALDVERARIVGHDWGALAGYLIALERPNRVERLVTMGSVHPWSAIGSNPLIFLRPWHIYLLASPAGEAIARRLPSFLLRHWRGRGAFTAAEARTYLERCTPSATHQRYRSIVTREIPYFVRRQRTLRLEVPTLALQGEADRLMAGIPDSFREFAPAMQWARLPGVGHFPAEEAPDTTLALVSTFLED